MTIETPPRMHDAETQDKWPFVLWLKIAVEHYRLSPSSFWTLSVKDWLGLMGQTSQRSLSFQDLEALQKAFPDLP